MINKHIKVFNTNSEYESFTATTEFELPNVSYCIQDGGVHYNPREAVVGNNISYMASSELTVDATLFTPNVAAQTYDAVTSAGTIEFNTPLVEIGEETFADMDELVSVTIPDSVVKIDDMAFANCESLTAVTIEAIEPPTLGVDVFENTNNCAIYVPEESIAVYESDWSDYAERVQPIAVVHATGVTLDTDAMTITVGNTSGLTATVLPADAIDKSVVWSTSDNTIATVDSNGVVSGVAIGNATITVTTVDGSFSDTCSITVQEDVSKGPLTLIVEEGEYGTIIFDKSSSSGQISYIKNNEEPVQCSGGDNRIDVQPGDTITFVGDLVPGNGGIGDFSDSYGGVKFRAQGDVRSLLGGYNFTGVTSLPDRAFMHLFAGCTALTSIEHLAFPVTTVGESSCERMFAACTGITTVPSNLLPATTLVYRCYANMFDGCSGLTNVPNLPATTLVSTCYQGMFFGCTSLTSVPSNLLPATRLDYCCYQYMFQGCSALTTAPDLLAPTLSSNSYASMFQGCSSLSYIKCLATDISEQYCTSFWVDGVAASGTFVKASAADWTSVWGADGIPEGWTVQDA